MSNKMNTINHQVLKSSDAQLITKSNYISKKLRWLAYKPLIDVVSYRKYPINGYYFYAKAHIDIHSVQNSEMSLVVQALQISSAKDNKPIFTNIHTMGDRGHM